MICILAVQWIFDKSRIVSDPSLTSLDTFEEISIIVDSIVSQDPFYLGIFVSSSKWRLTGIRNRHRPPIISEGDA